DVFNMGGGPENTISLIELLDMLKSLLNNKKISYEFYDWRPSDQKVYISDIRKAKTSLKWEPKVSPEDGVKALLNWLRTNQFYQKK
ncbi:MAG: CDP-paratose 2-epimerase, partial [Promethearchaeota archaeon]